jgi:signal transduction histidine kinase/CheY-like chemotaxis protein
MNAGPSTWSWLPPGGGATADLVRSVDWSCTAIGPVETWSTSLKTTLATMLHSRHPMFLWWGPELVQFYNDAYIPSFGAGRHPSAIGQRGRECWAEIWPIIGPQIEGVMQRAESTFHEDHLVPIFRNGRMEEVYWTYGYSPVYEVDGSVAGTLVVVTETTSRVLAERRARSIRVLGETLARTIDSDEVLHAAAPVLATAGPDVPWALLFDVERDGVPRLAASSGLDQNRAREIAAEVVSRLAAPARTGPEIELFALPDRLVSPTAVEPTTHAVALPVVPFDGGVPTAHVVFGLGPRLPYDAHYRDHLRAIAGHLGAAQARIAALRARAAVESERNDLLLQAPFPTALLIGPTHVFELASPLYERMVGRSVIGKAYVEAFPELVGADVVEILDRVYRTGVPYTAKEQRIPLARQSDGAIEDAFFNFQVQPIRDETGAVYGMMAVAFEITEQVLARQVLERASVERERLLAELETASRAKDEFLAMLGHELRNPLAPIVTALDLIRMRGASSEREHELMERHVAHLVRLVDDLLDVSKVARGKIELRREVADVGDVVARAIEMASGLYEQRHHELRVDVCRGTFWLGDPTRLSQVIANILTNAARYTSEGGHVTLSAAREGDELVVRVRDDGLGIAPEILPRIFDAFFQGDRSFDRREGGLGLGLTLVRTLVEMHGGRVEAHSEGLGRGSEFVVRVPGIVEHSDAPSRRVPTAPPAAGSAERILVVDDNVDAADLIADVLRAAGHDVVAAYDPASALAVLDRFVPTVALLDIGLPVLDGYQLAARMRARPGVDRCRFVALTGFGQEGDAERSRAAGFDRHLVKPIDLEALTDLLAPAPATSSDASV